MARTVLIVIGQLEVGGTERHLLTMMPAVQGDDVDVTVYAMRGGGALEPALCAAGIEVVSPRHHSRRIVGLARTAVHLLGTLARRRPHIVHFFLPEAYLLGAPLSLVAVRCLRVMSRRSLNAYQRRWPFAAAIERVLHRRMDAVLANSVAIRAELLTEGIDAGRVGLIPNGVATAAPAERDARIATRARLDTPDDAFVLVKVANFIDYKGHADLVDALARAGSDLPADWLVWLLGRDDGIRATIEARADAVGIREHVRFIDPVADVGPFLAAADVAVSASHEEGSSNAVLEAMAHALPVVATRVGGNAEVVVDGETGVLVAPREPDAIAEALVALAHDPVRRDTLGAAGRARVAERFSVATCVARYRRLYAGLERGSVVDDDVLAMSSE